jgi:serine/threonine-protein kinase RsbW
MRWRAWETAMVPQADTKLSGARSFEARPSSLSQMRGFVREMAGRGGLSPEATMDLLLAVSEACTNAVVHSGSPTLVLEWMQRGEGVNVAVKDRGVFHPEDDREGRAPTAGLGFTLMHGTVDRVLVEPGTTRNPGTVVWLEKSFREEAVRESA